MSAPRAAYVHVPFCAHRCGYCNFTVVAGRDDLVEPYLESITRELSWLERPGEVDTLFFGGGTPSYLQPDFLNRLLSIVLRWFPLAEGCEFTVEANPDNLDAERVEILAEHGVTRISLGAQSFDSKKLRLLERDHTAQDIEQSLQFVREHFHSVAVDLIFATPGETLDLWRSDLTALVRLKPDHVSTYGLTFERGTTFWGRRHKGLLKQVDETLDREMFELAIETLLAAGFEHYEISNFALPGHRSRHNEVYWTGGSYFAVGPGAARYVDGRRETNHRSTTTYIKRVLAGRSPVAETESLDPDDVARELLVFGLRRLEGIDLEEFTRRTGFEIDALVGESLRRHLQHGLLEQVDNRLRLTRQGLFVSDSIWPDFLRC